MEADKLLTVQEVAEITGQAVGTLNKARTEGTVNAPAFVKIGRLVRYRLSTVQHWIERHTERQCTREARA